MLDVLELGALARGKHAEAAQRAFEAFLGFADNVNSIGLVNPTVTDLQGFAVNYTETERLEINRAARAAITHLRSAIDELLMVVPRRPHERPLLDDSAMPLVTGSPDPYRGKLSPGE